MRRLLGIYKRSTLGSNKLELLWRLRIASTDVFSHLRGARANLQLRETSLKNVQRCAHLSHCDGERRREGNDVPHGHLEAQTFAQGAVHDPLGIVRRGFTRHAVLY